MNNVIEAGDVVYLRSGSPAMTVIVVNPQNVAAVTWFGTYQSYPQNADIHVNCLVKAQREIKHI